MINISYLEMELNQNGKLRDSMHLTAKPLYKNINVRFENIHRMVKSDRRQYSPFTFKGGLKKSENWSNEKQNILVLDIDDGLSIEESRNIFNGFQYLICTTKSHQKEKRGIICDRYRIILKAVNIPVGDDYFIFTNELELIYPFIDKQVNTKTGAFLGYEECDYKYYEGKEFECKHLLEVGLLRDKLKQEVKITSQSNFNKPTSYENDLPLEDIKNRLTRDTVADIVQSLGYEINSKYMFKYRTDERSPSTSIKQGLNPLIKDFGASDELTTDAIGFVQKVKDCNFKEAVKYVSSFVNIDI